jgi:hypothetical protein
MLVSLVLPFQLMRQLHHEQAEARADALVEMKQKHLTKALRYLAIPNDELEGRGSRFVRIHATEFVWDGVMYDIVSSFPEAHQTWFLVYPDFKETKVLNQKIALAKAFQSEAGLTKTTSKNSISFHWFAGNSSSFAFPAGRTSEISLPAFSEHYFLQLTQRIDHPPQFNWFIL